MTSYLKYCTNLLTIALILISCNKNAENLISPLGKGSFTFETEKYAGGIVIKTPSSSGFLNEYDVSISCSPGNAVLIYNMPNSSSGNFSIYDAPSVLSTNKIWLGVGFQPNTTFYNPALGMLVSSSGTITKTGSNSFTFTCQVYYQLKPSTKYTVTGKGSY
jgi:hypothetical protein